MMTFDLNFSRADFQLQASGQVQPGEILAITGPSGAGKTTLLRLLAGLERPDAGYIQSENQFYFDYRSRKAESGASPRAINLRPQARSLGFVFQDYALFPHLTVRQNIAFGLKAAGKAERVDQLLRQFELQDLQDRKPHQLSGGQQQRVALARALAPQPKILLLDEPLAALDTTLRAQLQELLRNLPCRDKMFIILVSHDRQEIIRLADKLMVLEKGSVTDFTDPISYYQSELMAEIIQIQPKAEHWVLTVMVGDQLSTLGISSSQAEGLTIGQRIPYHRFSR